MTYPCALRLVGAPSCLGRRRASGVEPFASAAAVHWVWCPFLPRPPQCIGCGALCPGRRSALGVVPPSLPRPPQRIGCGALCLGFVGGCVWRGWVCGLCVCGLCVCVCVCVCVSGGLGLPDVVSGGLGIPWHS